MKVTSSRTSSSSSHRNFLLRRQGSLWPPVSWPPGFPFVHLPPPSHCHLPCFHLFNYHPPGACPLPTPAYPPFPFYDYSPTSYPSLPPPCSPLLTFSLLFPQAPISWLPVPHLLAPLTSHTPTLPLSTTSPLQFPISPLPAFWSPELPSHPCLPFLWPPSFPHSPPAS